MGLHTHLGYDGTIPYEHDHEGHEVEHNHRHSHDGYTDTHDHHQTDPSKDHDHGPVTHCGHLGDDVGTVRTVIKDHRGQPDRVLCGPCGASDHWTAWDVEIDAQ